MQIEDRLDSGLAGAEIRLRGTVASLPERAPDHLRFLFRPSEAQARLAGLPSLIEVRWYQADSELRPGEAWRFKLRLRPPRGLLNFEGIDRERALFAARIGAVASVLEAQRLSPGYDSHPGPDGVRANVRGQIRAILPPGPGRALVLSLAIADRDELENSTWRLLRATGTGHLLAISGLHIGLAAVAGFWVMRGLLWSCWTPLGAGRRGFMACGAGALLAAFGYGALAGFPVSTQRALAMLAAALCVIAAGRGSGALRAWLLALLVVLAIDPFAPLGPGFWLSFGAVLALIAFFAPRGPAASGWAALPRAQAAVMVLMLPLSAFWFQSGSWLAFPTNLLAIPWVSFVSVPLVLAGVALLPAPLVAGPLLELAWWSCAALHELLEAAASLEDGRSWLTPSAGIAATGLALGGGLLLLLPRGLAVRWLGGCLLAILFLPRAATLADGEFSVESLDVGQGQAVLVHTRKHALLYDTGPGDGVSWSLFESVLAPALAAEGRNAPDLVTVSHGDLDHAGGLADLLAHYGPLEVRFNDSDRAREPCVEGLSWTWDGVNFRVLHPSPWLPYLGNDSSCVISIDNGQHRALLSGDIGSVVEQRLAAGIGVHALMTVPHHGSASSSTPGLLSAVRPRLAVVSAAYGNRFGFPRPEVVARYARSGGELLSTIDCGAVRVLFPRNGDLKVETARASRDRPWRWHPEAPCMVTSDYPMYHLSGMKSGR